MAETLALTNPEVDFQDSSVVTAESLVLSAAGFAQRFDIEVPSEEVLKAAIMPSPELPHADCTYVKGTEGGSHMWV